MDSLIETIAAWPWHAIAAYSAATVAWSLCGYLAIRRLVRWVRARRVVSFSVCDAICASMEQEPAKWRMAALTLDGPKGWSLWNDAACSSWQMYRGGIKFSHKERRRIGQAARAWTVRRVTPATEASKDQPRPTEKSAPYVLDTSREIRELRERVEALEDNNWCAELCPRCNGRGWYKTGGGTIAYDCGKCNKTGIHHYKPTNPV